VGIVVAEDKLAEAKLAWMLPVRTLTQLLGSSWPRLTAIVRSCSMYQPGELVGHWSPKARGVERDAKRGWYFTGRTNVLRELVAWLAGGQADGRVRVVTAGPGSGKSAVLARLVTLSDPVYRERVPDLDSTDPAVPPAGSIDVAVWAHAKTIEDVVAAIAQATEVDADSPDALINGLLERDRLCTIVVDALDEAVEPAGVAGKLLRPLAADAASAGVRVLVGSRPGRQDELIDALGRGAVRLDLDQPPYLERSDLVEFVYRRLLLADDPTARTPYRGQEELAGRVADAVADRAYPTFLVAQLTSTALARRDGVVDVEAPGWELAFPDSVADAMDDYLDRLAEDAASEQERRAGKRRLRELLTPLAYAEGDGLPRALWPAAATALADRSYGLEELDWLVDTAPDYLVEQSAAEGGPIYRLYHEALAEYLRPSTHDESTVQRGLVTALLETLSARSGGFGRDWAAAHPYLRTHLARHAASAGMLDELLTDPGFLLAANPTRLLSALPAVITSPGRKAAMVFRSAIHDMQDGDAERASYLELHARQAGADQLADQIAHLDLPKPWSTRWAAWRAPHPHQLVGRHTDEVIALAVGELNEQPVVASADHETVRVWALESGTPICPPQAASHPISLAIASVHGRPVLLSTEVGGVQVRDLATGTPTGPPLIGGHSQGAATRVVAAQLRGRPVVVTGGLGMARVWDLADRRPVEPPLRVGEDRKVASLTLGELADRPVVVAAAGRQCFIWDLLKAEPVGVGRFSHDDTSPGVRAALATVGDRPVVVVAGRQVQLWDPFTGRPVGDPITSTQAVDVAVGRLDGRSVVAFGTYDYDKTIEVWDLLDRQLVSRLGGHNDYVGTLEFGVLHGRHVLVSGGEDGTVRAWDLADAAMSGDREDIPTVNAVAVAEQAGRRLVVTGARGGVLALRRLDDGEAVRSPLTVHDKSVNALAVASIEGASVVVSGGTDGAVYAWDLDQEIRLLGRHDGSVRSLTVTDGPRGPLVLAAGHDRRITAHPLRPVRNRAPTAITTGHAGDIDALIVTELDGRRVVVSGGADNTIQVSDLVDGHPVIAPISAYERGGVGALAAGRLAGRTFLVSGGGLGDEAAIRFWDLSTRAEVYPPHFLEHKIHNWINVVLVAEVLGRRLILAGGHDGTLRILRLLEADWGLVVRGLSDIRSLALGPGGAVVVGSERGVLLLELNEAAFA
jgi:WD40 repeat protein